MPHVVTDTFAHVMLTRRAALSGLLAGAVAVASGVVIAAAIDVVSPVDAVGSEVIDRSPGSVKAWAIEQFGTSDKTVLRLGIYTILVIAAFTLGALSARRRTIGTTGIAAFGAVGALAALNRPDQGLLATIPSVLGALAGIAVLHWLLRLATQTLHSAPAADDTAPPPDVAPFDRRRFLIASGATAAAAYTLGASGIALTKVRLNNLRRQASRPLPPLDRPVAGTPTGAQLFDETPFLTPNSRFYRIDTALSFPRATLDEWTLTIDGMVDRPLTFTYDDLLAREQVERTITLCCVSNAIGGPLVGNARWQGVMLRDLLEEAGVRPSAEQVFSTSADGWTSGFPVAAALDGRDAMVVLGMNGETLPIEHGFPARLVVPGLYGYVSATKWLERITLTTWDDAGYWLQYGWAKDAPVKTQSRIDVPRPSSTIEAGRHAVAGIAWAQHRGIERVEVSIDDGPWLEATLAVDVSDDTWRQWMIEWDATPGEHTIAVRATDKDGETQTADRADSYPDGATGHHTIQLTVE